MERLKDQAWHKATQKFRQHLDVTEIYGHLCSRSYLTGTQKEKLRSPSVKRYENIDELMEWMPAKGGSWFADFVSMLKQTTTGTGHSTIIQALKDNLREVHAG